MLATLREDIRTVLARDPAAHHWLQVALFYPGLHAIWAHRLAHRLWRANLKLPAHGVAYLARRITGIEIHPAARLGPRLFIDHGMGVVIGETAEVGPDVTIYHGVTLGGVSLQRGKRHPTIKAGVVIGAGAKVLGAITVGENTRIGANAVVVKDVEPGKVVVGVPGRPVSRDGASPSPRQPDFQHNNLPDVISERLDVVLTRLDRLEQAIRAWANDCLPEDAGQPEPDYVI